MTDDDDHTTKDAAIAFCNLPEHSQVRILRQMDLDARVVLLGELAELYRLGYERC